MDFFERVGNFFTGGGWSSNSERSKADADRKRREEEERKRREAEAAARAAAAEAQRKQQAAATPNPQKAFVDAMTKQVTQPNATQPSTAPRPSSVQVPAALSAPKSTANQDPDLLGLSQEDANTVARLKSQGKPYQKFAEAARTSNAAKQKSDYENSPVGIVANTIGETGKSLAQGFARLPETVYRSAILEPLVGNATRSREEAISTASDPNTGLRAVLYGEDPVQSYQEQARNIQGAVKSLTEGRFKDSKAVTDLAVFAAPLLAVLDLGTGGKGRTTVKATEDAIKVIEKQVGRKLDDAEKEVIKQQVEARLNKGGKNPADAETPEAPTPSKNEQPNSPSVNKPTDVPTEAPTVKASDAKSISEAPQDARDVASSYQSIYNAINDDKALSPQQKIDLIDEARKRHIELLRQVDEKISAGEQAAKDTVAKAEDIQQNAQSQLEQNVADAQAKQLEQVQPTPEQIAQDTPLPQNGEVNANDAFRELQSPETIAERDARIEARQNAQKVNPLEKIWNSTRRQLYDSNLIGQKIDNAILKTKKANGGLRRGQSDLNADQSVVTQTAIINSPDASARSFMRDSGIEKTVKAIKKQGKQYEKDFNNYRLFKDELFNQMNGEPASLNVAPEEMANFVRQMEASHPEFVPLNNEIRQYHLSLLKKRVDEGIDEPAVYERASNNPYYAPRETVKAEDGISPEISGVVNKSGKQTKSRTGNSDNTLVSLDSIFNDTVNTIRGAAAQRRASLLNESGFGRITQSATAAAARRDSLREAESIRGDINDAKALRDSIVANLRKAKSATASNTRQAKNADAKVNSLVKSDEAKLKKLQDSMYEKLKKSIALARNDENSVFRDLVVRDPRYAEEAAQIQSRTYPNLTPKEARDQKAFDMKELDAKYPEPKLTDKDIRRLSQELSGFSVNDIEANPLIADYMAKSAAKKEAAAMSSEEADAFRGMLEQTRQDIKDSQSTVSDIYSGMKDIGLNPKTGEVELTYFYDGAPGKMAIPSEYARELASLNKQFNSSPVGKLVNVVGGGIKATLTGVLNPLFQLVKTPIFNTGLMFRNADGLSGVNPAALSQFLKSVVITPQSREFRRSAVQAGAQYENATKSLIMRRSVMDDIEARSSIGNFIMRNPIQTAGDVGRAINNALAHVSNAQRDAVIAGAISRYKSLNPGVSDAEALQYGAQAAAKVFGDFNRVSNLARALDSSGALVFGGAIQAGARAIARASKTKPVETLAKDALIIGSLGGLTAWSLMNNAKEYYDAMDEQGNKFDYENNLILAIGPVSQNEDGSWNGIIKIPLTPDLRPLNRGVVSAVRAINDDNPDTNVGAAQMGELFNFFTGDTASSLYDPSRTDNGYDPLGGVLSQSPTINLFRIAGNRNLYTGGEYLNDSQTALSPSLQGRDFASPAAVAISDAVSNVLTPAQADQLLSQMSSAGKGIKAINNDNNKDPLSEFFNVASAFMPTSKTDKSKLESRQYFNDVESVARNARANGVDEATYNAFMALHSKKNERSKDNMLNSANKAAQYMEYVGDGTFGTSQLYSMEKALDDAQRAQGKPGNPLFDLSPQELQAVLTYRSMKVSNAAKQNYSKGGEGAFTSLGLDEPWYQQFRDAESNYYNSLGTSSDTETRKTFSGKVAPELTSEQKALQDQYFSLPAGSQARKEFLKSNDWLKKYWEADNEFTDEERKALGFSIESEDDSKKNGYGSGNYSPYGLLGQITNLGDNVKRISEVSPKTYDKIDAQLAAELKRLFAAQAGGGRASVPIGAQSRGDTS